MHLHWELPFGKTSLVLRLPPNLQADLILPHHQVPHPDPEQAIYHAIANPIGHPPLRDIPRPTSVAIAINDSTRPLPLHILLPPLLEALGQMGIKPEEIVFLIATGTHKPVDPASLEAFIPSDILRTYHVLSHSATDSENLIFLGHTSRGTPVYVNRFFYTAEFRIALGNIEPHHFMGYSGGAKTVAIGLAGLETITRNHQMLIHPNARAGTFMDNPMRQDVEEIGRMMGLHFVLNTILNEAHQVVHVLAGDPYQVMRKGIPLVQNVYMVKAHTDYDLVIASAGGHPKDVNLYQAQKALTHATMFARPGGVIILCAACPEGSGHPGLEAFLEGVSNYQQALEKFERTGFRLGPHKAFQIARQVARNSILLVSEMPRSLVEKCLLTYAPDLETALEIAYNIVGTNPRIAILPYATHTLPISQST
ncbi:nickel-dependent lactate racemase [uncultured Thermanaerothrix sp.]|uniref:nickel-dependent lactate racemase n=1 Tax=uncultured Thermanaerothrix sp. TaxID=1195149 RepID=UPI00262669BF|nr:nickel-dependent lactate racemase [uncultured Thermanaerothrix sp.]